MGLWVDVLPVVDGLVTYLDTQLPDTVTVVADEAPEQLAGPTVVVETVGAPRDGPPLSERDTLELEALITSLAWDVTARRSVPRQARLLADQVADLVAHLGLSDLPDLAVLRSETVGDGRPVKNGALWSVPETFRLTVLANP